MVYDSEPGLDPDDPVIRGRKWIQPAIPSCTARVDAYSIEPTPGTITLGTSDSFTVSAQFNLEKKLFVCADQSGGQYDRQPFGPENPLNDGCLDLFIKVSICINVAIRRPRRSGRLRNRLPGCQTGGCDVGYGLRVVRDTWPTHAETVYGHLKTSSMTRPHRFRLPHGRTGDRA